MSEKEKLLYEALQLSSVEKADIIEQLIKSLDEPDAAIDKLWMKESENRIDAYERGEISSITVEEVVQKYKSR
ncbi:MAG: addiction module protein [Balneolaceae bacterium]